MPARARLRVELILAVVTHASIPVEPACSTPARPPQRHLQASPALWLTKYATTCTTCVKSVIDNIPQWADLPVMNAQTHAQAYCFQSSSGRMH